MISDFWTSRQLRKSSFSSLQELWDKGKSKNKGLTVNYSKSKNKNRKMEYSLLTRLALHLKAQVDAARYITL